MFPLPIGHRSASASVGMKPHVKARVCQSPFYGTPQKLQNACKPVLYSRERLVTRAELSSKGVSHRAEQITVQKPMGQGSYGEVFQGLLQNGSAQPETVVLKRVKAKVEGAEEMGQMEHLLNVYASKAAKGSIADFIGYCEVQEHEANRQLTPGLWLMWKYEGHKTLAYYLKRRDCVSALARDLDVPEEAAVSVVMRHIFDSLQALHAAGLVHRDVKPLNIIFAEEERKFKLIDLGAAADLRSGTNYQPDESILDPIYCPPEQYCMPTDSPHLAKQAFPIAMVISPLLWARHKPDRFDSYSTGLVLMQLAIPRLRTNSGLQNFSKALAAVDYNLLAWRDSANLSAREAAILDADNGIGWDLAAALLRPRKVEFDEYGGVKFVNSGAAIRMPAKGAVRHAFIKKGAERVGQHVATQGRGAGAGQTGRTTVAAKAEPGSSKTGRQGRGGTTREALEDEEALPVVKTKVGAFGMAFQAWKQASGKLFDLESKIMNQATSARIQTSTVKKLQADVEAGRATPAELNRAVTLLGRMTNRLNTLQDEFRATANSTNSLLSGLLSSPGGTDTTSQQGGLQQPVEPAKPTLAQRFGFGKRLGSGRQRVQPGTGLEGGSGAVKIAVAKKEQGGTTGFGGWWSRSGKRRVSEVDREAASAAEEAAAASAAAAKATATGTTTNRAVPAGGLAARASNMIYASLKLTGFALNVATDLAQSIGKDAEKMMADRNQRTGGTASAKVLAGGEVGPSRSNLADNTTFMDMLRECQPPITSSTAWPSLARRLSSDARFQKVPEFRRERLFVTFQEAVAKVEVATARKAEAAFKGLLAEAGVPASAKWLQVSGSGALNKDPRWAAVAGDAERRRIFGEHVAELAAAAVAQERTRNAEAAFREMLEDLQPPLCAGMTWPTVKRQVWEDPRFEAVSEKRRRQIYQQFAAVLAETEARRAQEAAEEAEREAEREAEERLGWSSDDDEVIPQVEGTAIRRTKQREAALAKAQAEQQTALVPDSLKTEAEEEQEAAEEEGRKLIEALRLEQARLKSEYNRMEAKLREMEARFVVSELRGEEDEAPPAEGTGQVLGQLKSSGSGGEASIMTSDSNGNLVFRVAREDQVSREQQEKAMANLQNGAIQNGAARKMTL